MRIAIIGTYPPTRCGIATFTADVTAGLRETGVDVVVIPVDPPAFRIRDIGVTSWDPASYAWAASWINAASIDLVIVEHEFGIHGGAGGCHLLELTSRLTVPYVVTLHTVLRHFDSAQSTVLERLCSGAAAVTVFTESARRLVLEQEFATADAITVVAHGAPVELYSPPASTTIRDAIGWREGAPVLSTFGLLSPGKGLETAISAAADVVRRRPDLTYVIAGRTHPGVERVHGEDYRHRLESLVSRLGLERNVTFIDRFLTVDEIAELLSVTSVFVTPYRNEDQIVSGALTFALAAGCPVASTPYRYARDMLDTGAGIITPFDDDDAMGESISRLLDDGPARHRALSAARSMSASLSWPAVSQALRAVLDDALARRTPARPLVTERHRLVQPSDRHLAVLMDDTCVLQHSAIGVPRLEEGYCVDDAARLLPIAARLAAASDDERDGEQWRVAIPRLIAYLRAAAMDGDGKMRNFMSWDRRWLDDPHDGDHVGRAVWGLGELVHERDHVEEALDLLGLVAPRAASTPWTRNLAYTTLGLLAAGSVFPAGAALLERIHGQVRRWSWCADDPSWQWPEYRLTYDNARLPEVMIRLGAHIGDHDLVDRGLVCFSWLERRCRVDGYYRFPGHRGLANQEPIDESGDEQPLEAAAMADAAAAYLAVTGDRWALDVVDRAWSWFLGVNRLGDAPADLTTGACRDALCSAALNRNCGAESTIALHRCAHTRMTAHRSGWDRKTCSNEMPTTR